MVRYSDTSIERSTFAMLGQRVTMTFEVKDPSVSENLAVSENLRVQTYEYVRKSFGSKFCNNCRRGFLCTDVCSLATLPMGG